MRERGAGSDRIGKEDQNWRKRRNASAKPLKCHS